MTNVNTFLKIPFPFYDFEANLKICDIYPPSVIDMIEKNGFSLSSIFTLSQEEIEDKLVEDKQNLKDIKILTPFEILFENVKREDIYKKRVEEAFFLFTQQHITFLFEINSILIGELEEVLSKIEDVSKLPLINEKNYFEFQNNIRTSLGATPVERFDPNEHPKIKQMKAKARLRDKIKAKRGGGLNFETSLVAICCMGFGINPLNIGEISFGSIKALMEMYQNKEKYTLDIDSLLAGADSKKVKPQYWIKN